MSIDVISLITKRRNSLLAKIITPHVPGWPTESDDVTFRFEPGTQLVYVKGVLVGAVKERCEIELSDLKDIPGAIRRTLEGWRVGDKVNHAIY